MWKRVVIGVLITLAGLGLVVGFLVGTKALQIKALIAAGGNFELPPEYVTSAIVKEESWRQTLNAVGSLTAVQGVLVSTEVAGKVDGLHFESGEPVESGQLLVELDTSTEEAQLAAAQAEADLASINLDRAERLRQTNTVAAAELDSAQAAFLAAKAQVENLEAMITKMRISAPFSGRLGIRQVNLGQFINNGDPIVSLQSLDPIFIDFAFPQSWVSRVATGLTVEVEVDSYPETLFEGRITAVDPEVDISTRSINLRATLDNPKGKLLPGMFGQVSVILPEEKLQKVLPATAVVHASYGDSVFVIREKDGRKIVEQQFVRVGEARGDFVSITAGPEVGSAIVSTGAFKLRQGMRVELNNKLAPSMNIDPKPEDS